MDDGHAVATPHRVWKSVARAVISLAALCTIGLWFLFSLFLWYFRCDESCSGREYEGWHWTGQLVLAGLGGSLGVVALTLDSRAHRRDYRYLLALAAGCGLLWLVWVPGSGRF